MRHAKGTAVLFAMDSNARSTLWHDKLTNARGRILEEFITSKQLYTANNDNDNTTFRDSLGTSNIDLTIISTHLLNNVTGRTICDQESISDHNFIPYNKAGIHCTQKSPQNSDTKQIRRPLLSFQQISTGYRRPSSKYSTTKPVK